MNLVTVAVTVLSILTLGLILMIDMVTEKNSFFVNIADIMNVGVGEGKYIMYTTWAAAFIVSAVTDYRRGKKQRGK